MERKDESPKLSNTDKKKSSNNQNRQANWNITCIINEQA